MERASGLRDTAFFVALIATAVALSGALAHAFALPNKIGMTREAYFTAQQIYFGWNQFAYVLLVQLIGIVAVIVLYRREGRVLWPAALALACLVAAQAVFWTWTFPAKCGDRQLEHAARGLGDLAFAVGIFAPRRRRLADARDGRAHRRRAASRSLTAERHCAAACRSIN
jgi:hypothetical protein